MTKILIAEDDPEIAMLERDYLEIEGFEVSVVDNGQQAVTQALNGDFSLILLDLMLPGCNGYDVCRLIRDGSMCPSLWSPPAPSRWTRFVGWAWGAGRLHPPSPLTRRSWWLG